MGIGVVERSIRMKKVAGRLTNRNDAVYLFEDHALHHVQPYIQGKGRPGKARHGTIK